jgi:hypothetical protein
MSWLVPHTVGATSDITKLSDADLQAGAAKANARTDIQGQFLQKFYARETARRAALPKPLAPPPGLPDLGQLNSDAQAAANLAGVKRRKSAMAGGILGPKPGGVASVAPTLKAKALIGGGY